VTKNFAQILDKVQEGLPYCTYATPTKGYKMQNVKTLDAYEINTDDGSIVDRVCFSCASAWVKELTGAELKSDEPFEQDGVSASWHWPENDETRVCWCGALLED
jgi:hypothetical protein